MTRETVHISTSYIKLSALLKFCGAAETGGMAKEMIASGEVYVDGEICLISGKKLLPGAVVRISGYEYEVSAG